MIEIYQSSSVVFLRVVHCCSETRMLLCSHCSYKGFIQMTQRQKHGEVMLNDGWNLKLDFCKWNLSSRRIKNISEIWTIPDILYHNFDQEQNLRQKRKKEVPTYLEKHLLQNHIDVVELCCLLRKDWVDSALEGYLCWFKGMKGLKLPIEFCWLKLSPL